MQTISYLLLSALLASTSAFQNGKVLVRVGDVQDPSFEHHMTVEEKFNEYKSFFNKAYSTVEAEAAAFDAFVENEAIILEHNAKGLSFTLGHNEHSDLTWEGFKVRMGLHHKKPLKSKASATHNYNKSVALPDSVDWVTAGGVTPVKNQGQCGSCWAFSTTGSTEGAYFVASKKLVSLSEQDLVSCDKTDNGCKGGAMDNGFAFIEKSGICAEADYPYTSAAGKDGTCETTCTKAVTVTGHTDVTPKDEDALKSAVAQQPVSIAIEADKSVFQLYKSGVFDNSACGTKLDHGVLVVGYGTDGSDYWKVKNSWGATWGEEGFIRMVRGKNQCGISEDPSYPTGAKAAAPGPGPTPTPPTPSGATHYEDPNTTGSCQTGEVDIKINGVTGSVCAPECTMSFSTCPTDLPTGVTAAPQCALQDASSGKKYCALICSPSEEIEDQQAADAQCGTNASCKPISGVGICTYDSR